jgi:hypothetical protein
VTPQAFRRLALSLPEAYEGAHMGHADFRVGKRVFATLGYPDAAAGMVKLTPSQQAEAVGSAPTVFRPVKGKWGAKGATQVQLRAATVKRLQGALEQAWSNVAPKSLVARATQRERITAEIRNAYQRYLGIALRLPGAEASTSYGTPSVKIAGKLLSRWRSEAEGALAIRCGFLDRQILLQADPEVFFTTDHYRDYPVVLVRLDRIGKAALADVVERAWRLVAPKRLQRQRGEQRLSSGGASRGR